LLEALLESALEGDLIESMRHALRPNGLNTSQKYAQTLPPPKRITTSNFAKYSKVVMNFTADAQPIYRKEPECRTLSSAASQPIANATLSS
uniref:ELM2 domain-containing protein n=1 Tax=Gongylonema pulchrum TaxID=637853 RepID=A0A183DEE0_9BILA